MEDDRTPPSRQCCTAKRYPAAGLIRAGKGDHRSLSVEKISHRDFDGVAVAAARGRVGTSGLLSEGLKGQCYAILNDSTGGNGAGEQAFWEGDSTL